jgi:uncharacterized membrane protein YfcA
MLDFIVNRKMRVALFMLMAATVAVVGLQSGQDAGIDKIGLMAVAALFASAAVCEFIDTSLGMGYGTSLTPILILAGFSPAEVIPSVLASELVTGGFASFMHWRDGNFDSGEDICANAMIPVMVLLSTAGAVAAVIFSVKLSAEAWQYVIVGIICSMGVILLFLKESGGGVRPYRLFLISLVASFNKGVSGGGYGPLMTAGQVTSGILSKNAVAVTSFTEFFTSLVAFAAFMAAGAKLNWNLMLPLMLGAVSVVPFATLTVKNIRENTLRRLIGGLTLILGILVAVKAFIN